MYKAGSNEGIIVIKGNEISDYLNKLYTCDGKYPTGISLSPKAKSIVVHNVINHHLYKLFDIDDETTTVLIINSILNNVDPKNLNIDAVSLDLICVMLEQDIIKVLKYVFEYTDDDIASHSTLPAILNTIKMDLLFILNNF